LCKLLTEVKQILDESDKLDVLEWLQSESSLLDKDVNAWTESPTSSLWNAPERRLDGEEE
jgi:hypothetical protein